MEAFIQGIGALIAFMKMYILHVLTIMLTTSNLCKEMRVTIHPSKHTEVAMRLLVCHERQTSNDT